jgi:hypothetical protein
MVIEQCKLYLKKHNKEIQWILIILYVFLVIRMALLPSSYGFWFPFVLSFLVIGIGIGVIAALIYLGISLFSKKVEFNDILLSVSLILVLACHLFVYFPPLKIIVPNNFSGEVNLVVHPENKKKLIIDSNGVGFIPKSIFLNSTGDKKPIVYYQNGKTIPAEKIIGFDSIFFYGEGRYNGKEALKFIIQK